MNAKLDCPGVPKMQSFSVWSMVSTPKSIAIVVVVFMLPWPGLSMPTDSEVISASVVSGASAEMALTVVVFPTPKPPAMMIFTGTGAFFGAPLPTRAVPTKWSGDCSYSMDHSHDALRVGGIVVQHMDVQLA